jgi:hypothetical protein
VEKEPMLNNVRDFGAFGDGVHDDREAIQAAIEDAKANASLSGGIFFPAGTYRVSRATGPGARWSLDLDAVQDFTVAGEGPSSIVKLVDTTSPTGDWHVFILRHGCRRVVFRDLTVDGNRAGLTGADEQTHGIEVEDGTADLTLDGCVLRDCFGDGVRLLGTAQGDGNVRRVRIEGCLFQANKRSGLGIQRALEQVVVANCFFDGTVSDQSIDFEPTGTDGPTDLVIQGCVIRHTNRTPAVTLSGIGGSDPLVRCKFADNLVLGGGIFCTDVRQLTIQGNIVLVTDLGAQQRVPVHIQRGGDSVVISGNLLVNDDAATGAVIALSEVNQRQVTRALISGNLCLARGGRGIQCRSCDDIAIRGNMVVATGSCRQGIFLDSESSAVDNVSVRDNDVVGDGTGTWTTGIHIGATAAGGIRGFSVVGNSIRDAAEGIRFAGSNFQRTPICALNRIDAAVGSPLLGLGSLPEDAIVVGGAASGGGSGAGSGAGRWLAGLGDPNGKVGGNVGDVFQRLDGGAGSTLYVKEAGDGTDAGWVSK